MLSDSDELYRRRSDEHLSGPAQLLYVKVAPAQGRWRHHSVPWTYCHRERIQPPHSHGPRRYLLAYYVICLAAVTVSLQQAHLAGILAACPDPLCRVCGYSNAGWHCENALTCLSCISAPCAM